MTRAVVRQRIQELERALTPPQFRRTLASMRPAELNAALSNLKKLEVELLGNEKAHISSAYHLDRLDKIIKK